MTFSVVCCVVFAYSVFDNFQTNVFGLCFYPLNFDFDASKKWFLLSLCTMGMFSFVVVHSVSMEKTNPILIFGFLFCLSSS
ncbi:hypothetical protein AtEden1_Chr4g0276751 [Arabidopsis thaliana]